MVTISDKARLIGELQREYDAVLADSEKVTEEIKALTAAFQVELRKLSNKQVANSEKLAALQDTIVKGMYV
jgi:CHASE3 domain sensor protein